MKCNILVSKVGVVMQVVRGAEFQCVVSGCACLLEFDEEMKLGFFLSSMRGFQGLSKDSQALLQLQQ